MLYYLSPPLPYILYNKYGNTSSMSPNDRNNWVCKVYVNSLVSMSETSCVSVRLVGKKNSNQLNIDETFIDQNDVA